MSFRGTSKINTQSSLYYINRNYNKFLKTHNQLSAQQQVLELEDDPMNATIGLKLNNIISKTNQYVRNIKTGIASLELVDGKLAGVKTQLDSARTILTGAANDSTTPEGRKANAQEILEVLQNIVMVGNSQDGSRYIFGGNNTKTEPFTVVNGKYVNYTGNDKDVNIVTDTGMTNSINISGTKTFGNMITTIGSRDMNPGVSMNTDHATSLSDLNGGDGVPKGKIVVYYSACPDGLEIDLSGCDTLEDVKDVIEKETLTYSRQLDPKYNKWLDGTNLDWRDLQDRYVKVTMNPEGNGISLMEYDLGEPLPSLTLKEEQRGLNYSGKPGYKVGDMGALANSADGDGELNVEHPVYNLKGVESGSGFYPALRVDDWANNGVATALGIRGSANKYDDLNKDPIMDGYLHGSDLNPRVNKNTLLADLEGYNDSTYTFTNGGKPESIAIRETSTDTNGVFDEWYLSGVSIGDNTGPNGELYAKAVNRGTKANPEIYVEIYTVTPDKAKASDLVATGVYNASINGGTVKLEEANSSGLTGTVGIVLPPDVGEATVSLAVEVSENLTASIHVPAFIEEQNEDGTPKDLFGIASGWSIRGLDKPPADKHDENHHASTDLEGDMSVNYRYDQQNQSLVVEICRPSYTDQPAKIVATGSLDMSNVQWDNDRTTEVISGRIALTGTEEFGQVSGSVYIELPANTGFTDNTAFGNGEANKTSITYQLQENAPAGTLVLGGAMEIQAETKGDLTDLGEMKLKEATLFKKGTTFDADIHLSNGGVIEANKPIEVDFLLPKGMNVPASHVAAGTVLAAGQEVKFVDEIVAGTVIPRDTYYTDGKAFPAAFTGMSVVTKDPSFNGGETTQHVDTMGYDLRATFATVEDFSRAVEEAGIYVTADVSADGKGLEFRSSLAGAWLTVSEDTDCYEQMNDKNQQLSDLNLDGLIKGVNTDNNGNTYVEVKYYAPDPNHPERNITLISESGEQFEIEPGYYVRVYNSAEEMKKEYENRDNKHALVAEGFVPAGKWNTAWKASDMAQDPTVVTPFDKNADKDVGIMGLFHGLTLEERNGSGVHGTVNLDYYNGKPMAEKKTNPDGTEEWVYDYLDNDQITVFPGGMRTEGTKHVTLQEVDIVNPTPGLNMDYSGTVHGTIQKIDDGGDIYTEIKIYRDNSNTKLLGKTDPAEAAGKDWIGRVAVYETDANGDIHTNPDGTRVILGYVTVADNQLVAGGDLEQFSITTGGMRNYGQEREENVFASLNDALDALNANDAEKCHDLIGVVQGDIDRILTARGEVGSRWNQMEYLQERHNDDVLQYTKTLTRTVGMDDDALSMAVLNYQASYQAYNAAMQVSAQILQTNLLQYI